MLPAGSSEASCPVTHKAPIGSLPAPQENESEEPWHAVTRMDKQGGKEWKDNSNKRKNGLDVQTTSGASAPNLVATGE